MARYDVYGFQDHTLDKARIHVETTCSITLELRDSSYWGAYYCTTQGAVRNFMLYENERGEWSTPEHNKHSVILLVNELDNMDDIQEKLTSSDEWPILLRSRTIPDMEDDEYHDE